MRGPCPAVALDENSLKGVPAGADVNGVKMVAEEADVAVVAGVEGVHTSCSNDRFELKDAFQRSATVCEERGAAH